MTDHATTTKGPGLARGPALILGAILSAFGLILFLKMGDTATAGFPDADVSGPTFLGFETNGWTAWFTTAAGALLLFGAAQHLLAKAISLVVGLALAACAVLGFIDGDVLGLAAANFWTSLGWAIAAGLLLLNVFSPRIDRERDDAQGEHRGTATHRREPLAAERTSTRTDRGVTGDEHSRGEGAAGEHRVTGTDSPATGSTSAQERPR